MKNRDEVFLKICKSFNDYGVKYVVCGAYACKLHGIEEISGQERFTNDYDFIIDSSEENIKQIKSALKEINPEVINLRDDDPKKYQTVKVAGENEIDLIAFTTRSDKKRRREDFGSVADFVLRNSTLPVLTVRPQQDRP